MVKGQINLQDQFLNHLRKERISICVELINGEKVNGVVKGFDNFSIIILDGEIQKLIYKHAISMITPYSKLEKLNER